jgi:hypothetical protein
MVTGVKLRDHPLLKHIDGPNWPPVWLQRRIDGFKAQTGEIGVLIYVYAASGSNKCDLVIEDENENYTGTLLFDDAKSSQQVADLLRQHIGKSIREISDLDLSFTL